MSVLLLELSCFLLSHIELIVIVQVVVDLLCFADAACSQIMCLRHVCVHRLKRSCQHARIVEVFSIAPKIMDTFILDGLKLHVT